MGDWRSQPRVERAALDNAREGSTAAIPKRLRIFFLDGPGDLRTAFMHWRAKRNDPGQTDLTFSGQLFDVAEELGAEVYALAWPGDRTRISEGRITVEHRPPPFRFRGGALYHVGQAAWAADLMALALRFRAHAVVAAAGPFPYLFAPLQAAGIRLIPVLHNTFWPSGNRPTGRAAQAVLRAQGWFFRRVADATLVVSPECERQLRELAGPTRGPVNQFRPQYPGLLVPTTHDGPGTPFRVLFAGRMEREKGVLDVLELAGRLELERPGRFAWTLCGSGSADRLVVREIASRGLRSCMTFRGRLARDELLREYAACHAVIVPTTAGFAEGLNRVALEAALSGRPAVISETSPATEVLGDAAFTVRAGDVDGYAQCLLRLADDEAVYRETSEAAVRVGQTLLDPRVTFRSVLADTFRALFAATGDHGA